MSILIKGMEMPTNCYTCPFCDDVEGVCIVLYAVEHKWERTHSCPLVPVPDHGRLVDADALLKEIEKFAGNHWTVAMIKKAPTIIPADKDGAE